MVHSAKEHYRQIFNRRTTGEVRTLAHIKRFLECLGGDVQVPEEMIEMSTRYGTSRIEAVDNILATDYVEKALPRLIALPEKLAILFEVKANLKRHEVEKLAAGGVRWIQPGL
ncbi:hypothetical protein [Rhizobium leguminosarum]|uniref:hypothetical protein n=1 Tax=Rhizobium leguminosarum TaxID=384 RepID=UPI003F7AFAFD